MTIAIARQPILDGQRTVYGYEFLFRYGFDNALNALNLGDGTVATELKGNLFKGPFHMPRMLIESARIIHELQNV